MSTEQIHLFAYAEADDAAKASMLYVALYENRRLFLDQPIVVNAGFHHNRSIKALDPTSAVTVETLKVWERGWDPKYRRETFLVEIDNQPSALGCYGEWLWWDEPGRYRVALDIHPAFSHHRQVQNTVVQSGRDRCRT